MDYKCHHMYPYRKEAEVNLIHTEDEKDGEEAGKVANYKT